MAATVDARLADYLNDKLQTYADFETLDALIANVKNQQILLQAQLDDAIKSHEESRTVVEEQGAKVRKQAADFERQQGDIDKRLLIVTNSDTTEDAVPAFEAKMAKLRALDLADNYLRTLQSVDVTKQQAADSLKSASKSTLHSYTLLFDLSLSLDPLQNATEGAAPHLVDHVREQATQLRIAIKDVFVAAVEELLGKILWPKPGVVVPESILEQWDTELGNLLALQLPELRANERKPGLGRSPKPIVLLPLEVLVKPLEARFKYHFYGDRPTNKLDKPEYFLSHVSDLLTAHNDFVTDFVQPVLLRGFRGTELAASPQYIDATSCLITALLPMVRVKLASVVKSVLSNARLLSHLIYELMSFDKMLEHEWHYDPGVPWRGLAWEVLVEQNAFDTWLQAEKNFALARYDAIVEDQSNSVIDYDSLAPTATKPTKGAYQILSLVETITERYRPLKSFSQKLKFLIDIQISIFDKFHARLHSGLDAYMSMTSSIGRTVQGVSAAEAASLQGISGLDRLCRIYGSSDYLERAMKDASDDVFFLDLWQELQDRAQRHDTAMVGDLQVSEVAQKTSSTLVPDEDGLSADSNSGALFDETAGAYARLRLRTEGVLVEALNSSLREQLRPYTRTNLWSSTSTPSSGGDESEIAAVSPDLVQPLELLRTSLAFLQRALSPLSLRRIIKQVGRNIDSYIFDRVLLVHSFSSHGGNQVRFDITVLASTISDSVGPGQGQLYLRRCIEAALLLTLDGTSDEGERSAWEEDAEADASTPGLWQVESKLFASNEDARTILEELGIESLSENEARKVLGRRVDISR